MQAEFPDTYADLWVYPHPPKKNEVYYLCQRMSPLYLAAMKWSVSLDKAIDHFSLDTVCIKSVFPNMYIGHCTVYTCLIVCIRKLSKLNKTVLYICKYRKYLIKGCPQYYYIFMSTF